MAKTNQINVKVNDPTNRAIEEFAEDRDYTMAEAVRRITESRLRGEGYLSREIYGDGEPEPVADGGVTVSRSVLSEMNAIFTIMALIGIVAFFSTAFVQIPIGPVDIVMYVFSCVLFIGITGAPLYTDFPERADQKIYQFKNQTIGKIRGIQS